MGTYVYSLRKKHITASLGCNHIDVASYEYAYKESFVSQGEYGYAEIQRLAGRVYSMAEKAREYFMQASLTEYGMTDHNFYFAMGGLTDGAPVYAMLGTLPTTGYDDNILSNPNVQSVGRLYKVGRGKWTVSDVCPSHDLEECTTKDGAPVYQCQRCDEFTTEKK